MVVFTDVLFCFLFHDLAHFCVPFSLFIIAVPTISRRVVIQALAGDDILDFNGLLIALPILDALCWIMYVMLSLMVSMSPVSQFHMEFGLL